MLCFQSVTLVRPHVPSVTDNKAGIRLKVLSADNTAPVRFAVNLTHQPPDVLEAKMQKEKEAAAAEMDDELDTDTQQTTRKIELVEDELEGIPDEAEKGSKLGVSLGLLFTGVGVYIDGFITVSVKELAEDTGGISRGGGVGEVDEKPEDTEDTASGEIKKRMSFQLMKARESKPRWIKLPFDKILVNKE